MGLCKGNRGNLMQHWTFAEVIEFLKQQFKSMHFITTHSMAPWTIPIKAKEGHCRRVFRQAGRRLGNLERPSIYEQHWKSLAVKSGLPYPSSAVFFASLWPANQGSIAICEFDATTANEIDGWIVNDDIADRFLHHVVFQGDWRYSIRSPQIWNNTAECQFIEMDTMRYSIDLRAERKKSQPATLYPEDVELLLSQIPSSPKCTVIMISSFSNQSGSMPLDQQRNSLATILVRGDFKLQADVRVGHEMASFVFTRGLQLQFEDLQERFVNWLEGIE
jgi:hypothetical protein